jgi:hypothetical protein
MSGLDKVTIFTFSPKQGMAERHNSQAILKYYSNSLSGDCASVVGVKRAVSGKLGSPTEAEPKCPSPSHRILRTLSYRIIFVEF